MNKLPILLALGLFAAAALADDDLMQEYLSAPALPPASLTDDAVEPEVTIIERGQDVIYEYRVRGQLYMAKIIPVAGPPYYLLDTDGDGALDTRDDQPWNMATQQWLLFDW
ncbi:DUF2782 domain-containing protein [Thiococcus pfennigii]|jgi:hypothetical protein|uniref:DUF2782 domain-containing protein n=1 Tax=Thiococcus pfennigii TaxID=1057 RepID=UPI001903EC7E|nr:DUF2782 domain-containing protein [Thiococcus pfennigii]MBK1701654.1 hypothetical protein [Thiococcus pfennigii]MBK1730497.1 hypothetical protein [Thiococcus pfennigii]